MSARDPEPCDGVTGEHHGPVRFYRTGWKCNAHSPWALAGQPEPPPGPGRPRDWPAPPPLRTPTARDRRHLTAVKPQEDR